MKKTTPAEQDAPTGGKVIAAMDYVESAGKDLATTVDPDPLELSANKNLLIENSAKEGTMA